MAEVISPIVGDRIWALDIPAAAVKFFQYLKWRSDFGGQLPARQIDMAREYGVTKQAVSKLLAPLCDLNIVLRPENEGRKGSSYRLHPFAARYDSEESMEAALRVAMARIKAGDLQNLKLPAYAAAPPPEGRPSLKVA